MSKAPFLEDTGIMLFPRHGRVYRGGEIIHSFASPVTLEKGDYFGMMMDREHVLLSFYHTRNGFRHDVGQLHLNTIASWDHVARAKRRLRWAVTLGISARILSNFPHLACSVV